MRDTPLAASGGVLFLLLAPTTVVLLMRALTGVDATASPGSVAAALREDPLLGLAVTSGALAGAALLVFLSTLRRELALPGWAAHAGTAWAASWFLASAVLFTAGDLAGHFDHPAGAKTIALLAYDVMVGPHNAILAGLLAAGVWRAARATPSWPAWHRRLSAAAAVAALVGGSLLAVAFVGLVGLLLLPVWLSATALLLPWRALGRARGVRASAIPA